MSEYCKTCFELQQKLEATEQECKLLKRAWKDRNIVAVVEEHEKLKQECEELKEKNFLVEQESINKSTALCNIEELKQENKLAKQLINGILKEFNLTNYDWENDQNEIHTELCDKFNRYKQALEKIEGTITEINDIIIDKQVNINPAVIEWKNLYMKKFKQISTIINEVKDGT